MTLPTLFVPHGAPTFALHPGAAGATLAAAVHRWPTPRAILVISAHWDTPQPTLGGAASAATVHDYYGFAEALYRLEYPAPGAPVVAEQAATLLNHAGFSASVDPLRGLDHAVWIPLRLMYPNADVPVLPMSIQSRRDPAYHWRLGQALAPLRADGVLLVASGNLTHNLRHWHSSQPGDPPPPYVESFSAWVWQHLQTGNTEALLDYRQCTPDAKDAHPTDEHLLPLFVALGAAGVAYRAERLYHGVAERILAMDSYALWPALPNKKPAD